MSKAIKATSEMIESIKKLFEDALNSGKFADGKINFTANLGTKTDKATLFFTELAWLKMQTLIDKFDTEVGWHGIASRGDKENEYFITDILVYPQTVTGATVTTDQEKYQTWLMSQPDDVFNNIRMQGHSHVRMGVTPSTTDEHLYERLLSQLDDDMFYIFLIWNKSNSKTIKIYDMAKNILFDTPDVTVKILNDKSGIESFMKEAKQLVVGTPTTYTASTSKTAAQTNKNNTESQKKGDKTKKKPKYRRKSSSSVDTSNTTNVDDDYDDDAWEYYKDQWYEKGPSYYGFGYGRY